MKIKKILTKILTAALLLTTAAAIIALPQRYVGECFKGFSLWAESVLPSLFPFMVISGIFIGTGMAQAAARPFSRMCGKIGLPAAGMPLFIMSACSGYPAGSRMLSDFRASGALNDSDCKKLAPLCSTAGPLFITGTVGYKAFGGGYAGAKLLFACLFSVISTSLIYCIFHKEKGVGDIRAPLVKRNNDALYDSFYGAVTAVCLAGGYIAFFYTLSRVLCDFKILSPVTYALSPIFGEQTAAALAGGLCEATGGCFALAGAGGFFALPLAGFLITFGGASIIAQQAGYLNKCGVKTGFFALFKFVQGIVCFAILCLFSLLGI